MGNDHINMLLKKKKQTNHQTFHKRLTLEDKGNHTWPVDHMWVKPDQETRQLCVLSGDPHDKNLPQFWMLSDIFTHIVLSFPVANSMENVHLFSRTETAEHIKLPSHSTTN